MARIADLEAKLAAMNTETGSAGKGDESGGDPIIELSTSTFASNNGQGYPPQQQQQQAQQQQQQQTFNNGYATTNGGNGTTSNPIGLLTSGNEQFDFSSFFLIPLNWPRNLPAPCKFCF